MMTNVGIMTVHQFFMKGKYMRSIYCFTNPLYTWHTCTSISLVRTLICVPFTRYKFWTCCQKRTSDFNEFLKQEGCIPGSHRWVLTDEVRIGSLQVPPFYYGLSVWKHSLYPQARFPVLPAVVLYPCKKKILKFKEALSLWMLCAPVFIFTSDSSALLGRPRCGHYLPYSIHFWVYAIFFFMRKRTKHKKILKSAIFV